MIEVVDNEVVSWATKVCQSHGSKSQITLKPPSMAVGVVSVHTYLIDLLPGFNRNASRNDNVAITLNYLVSVCAEDESVAHSVLGSLLYSAMDEPGYTISFDRDLTSFWQTQGIPEQPSFVIQLPLARPAHAAATRIRTYPTIRSFPTTSVDGLVLSSNDTPIPGARVTLRSLGNSTTTDNDGRFLFTSVRPGHSDEIFRVEAKGLDIELKSRRIASAKNQPLILKLTELED